MGSLDTKRPQLFENFPGIKIHTSIYKVLGKIVDGVISLIPAIESAQPGCTLGIQELCSLNIYAEKAKQLIQQSAESSKLYLVITGGASMSRCERTRDAIERSLRHMHSMVPEPLTTQIGEFLDFLSDAKFKINPSEEEAGKALLSLLRQADTTEESELMAFQIAASRLNLTSSRALLVERRCVRKLLDKFTGVDAKKERILKYFMYLLEKYGRKVQHDNSGCRESVDEANILHLGKTSSSCDVGSNEKIHMALEASHKNCEDGCQTDVSNTDAVPEEFRCPLSNKLMHDPVIISSGQTYERMFIEKWLKDGNDTCPKTNKKLMNFCMVPNSSLKSLICQWCRKHGLSMQDPISHPFPAAFHTCNDLHSTSISSINSVSSLLLENKIADYVFHSYHSNLSVISATSCYSDSSHVNAIESNVDAHYPMFSWSEDYQKFESFTHFTYDLYMKFFRELSELPLDMHIKALENLKYLFGADDAISRLMLSNGFIDALMKFLQDAYNSSNVAVQKTTVQILLTFLDNSRVGIPFLSDDACQLLTCLLDSEITLEALMIIRKLSSLQGCKSSFVASDVSHSILKVLDSQDTKCINIAVEILCQLSSIKEIEDQILSSKCFPKLVSFLREKQIAGCCLRLLRKLSDRVEGKSSIAEANDCIPSISELLESCNLEEKTDAVAILLSLCSHSQIYSLLVMKEGVIPSLVDISINGNPEGQEKSKKLLNLLRDLRQNDCQESSVPSLGSISPSVTALDRPPSPKNHSKRRNPTSKASGFFGRKIFFKPKSLALF